MRKSCASRRFAALLIALALSVASGFAYDDIAAGATPASVPTSAPAPVPTAVVPPVSEVAASSNGGRKMGGGSRCRGKARVVRFAHVNDVHNRLQAAGTSGERCLGPAAAAGRCFGGMGRVSSALRSLSQEADRNCELFIFLDAGDEFLGTLWDVVYKGRATARFQNALAVRPSAMVIGNHEFDFNGPAGLAPYINELKFPMLGACNADTSNEPIFLNLKKWTIVEKMGLRIAILGWITPDTPSLTSSVGKVTFKPVVESVRQCIQDLKRSKEGRKLDLIVGLSHTGYVPDQQTAAAIPELDLIIGGHSHTFLYTPRDRTPITDITVSGVNSTNCLERRACDPALGLYPTNINTNLCTTNHKDKQECRPKTVPVFQAFYFSKYMGTFRWDMRSMSVMDAQPLLLGGANSSSKVEEDPEILKIIQELRGPVDVFDNTIIGSVAVNLEGVFALSRSQETNFGSYLADLMRNYVNAQAGFVSRYGRVQFGMVNGGLIRGPIATGPVSTGGVLGALPFANLVAAKQLTGADIIAGLRNGLTGGLIGNGRFPQVSGMRIYHNNYVLRNIYVLDAAGNNEGPISPTTTYVMAAPDFVLNGGDQYPWAAPDLIYLSGPVINEVMIADLQAANPNPINVPNPTTTLRIIDCNKLPTGQTPTGPVYGPCSL